MRSAVSAGLGVIAWYWRMRYRILGHAHFPLFFSSATLYHVFVLKILEPCFQVGCGSGKPPFTLSLHDATRRIFGMLQLLIPGTMDFGGYVFVPDRIESFSLRFSSEKTHDNAITVLRFLLNYVVFEMLMFVAYLRFKHIASHCQFAEISPRLCPGYAWWMRSWNLSMRDGHMLLRGSGVSERRILHPVLRP